MSENLEILRDSWLGSELSVVESIDTPKGEYSSVVLATLKGPALDYIHDTRNRRGYEEELWDAVANSDYVKELFETKNFLGEPDHPMQWESRSDIHYPYVSHAIRELIKNPLNGCYDVVIDILDTPNGRILKTLIDYGVKLGVSSRGSGRTIQKNGRTIVDPKTYRFITIDIVPMPGNKAARMESTNESMKLEGFISAMTEQVEFLSESNNKDSLRYTRNLLSKLGYPECEGLLEKVNNLLEPSNTDTDSTKDLAEAYALVSDLRNKLESKDLTIKTLTETINSKVSEQNTISVLEENYKKAQDLVRASLMRESILSKKNSELTAQLSESASKIESLTNDVIRLSSNNKSLKSKLSKAEEQLEESANYSTEEYETLQESYNESENLVQSLTEQVNFISEKNKQIYESYLDLRCNQLGVDSNIVRRRLGDITSYSVNELNKFITETFKSNSSSKSTRPNNKLLENGTYTVRHHSSPMNESLDRSFELERLKTNVASVRMQ